MMSTVHVADDKRYIMSSARNPRNGKCASGERRYLKIGAESRETVGAVGSAKLQA